MLGDADKNLSTGLFGKPMTLQADQLLKDKDQLELAGFSDSGGSYTPGHTPGGCVLLFSGGAGAFLRGYPFLRLRGKNGFSGGK